MMNIFRIVSTDTNKLLHNKIQKLNQLFYKF
ncbi:hypothetical protein Mgra_00008693 [Meloidogyne graminicola]|uniref:Uncharacterized protein n=1 Tax=Meloidogyne graminicola TaxID=189291 RepID=A0A8S9ZF73_9BILA|nr:hypothetical protein Mgra_00008693 [Meloidogyne graminicola]